MKKLILIGSLIFCTSIYAQNYETELKDVNEIIQNNPSSDNLLTIEDGKKLVYSYGSFQTWIPIEKIDKMEVNKNMYQISLTCVNGEDCVRNSYMLPNETKLVIDPHTTFEKAEFVKRMQLLLDKLKPASKTKTPEKKVIKPKYKEAMDQLNTFLKTFDNGYYGYFEVVGDDIFLRFKKGKYNKIKMEDIQGAVIQEDYSRVIFKCKGSVKCISTDWKVDGKEEYMQFMTDSGGFDYEELATLLDNFKKTYLASK